MIILAKMLIIIVLNLLGNPEIMVGLISEIFIAQLFQSCGFEVVFEPEGVEKLWEVCDTAFCWLNVV